MEHKKLGNTYAIRLSPGEDVVESLITFASEQKIHTASIIGLGAADNVEIGLYDVGEKKYYKKEYKGEYEIASLSGSLTRKEDEPYLHLHIVIGNTETNECHAGHLNKAVISATAEIFITVLEGEIGRKVDDQTGLNIFKF